MSKSRVPVDDYITKHNLQHLVQDACSHCYSAQANDPVAYLAQYFSSRGPAHLVEALTARELPDGRGHATMKVTLSSYGARGARESAVVSHSNFFPHPSSARIRVSAFDGDEDRFGGFGCQRAVLAVKNVLEPAIQRQSTANQQQIDDILRSCDGSENLAQLGAQVVAAVSLANAKAAAVALGKPLFIHIGTQFFSEGGLAKTMALPTPIVSLVNQDPRQYGRVRIRDLSLIPMIEAAQNSNPSGIIMECFRRCSKVYAEFYKLSTSDVSPGPDGGIKFTGFDTVQQVVEMAEEAIKGAGLTPRVDMGIGITVDAGLVWKDDVAKYSLVEGTDLTPPQLTELLYNLLRDKPSIVYLEDTHHNNDDPEFRRLMTKCFAGVSGAPMVGVTLCGNNTYATSLASVTHGAEARWTNACCLRPTDAGTVSELIACGQTYKQLHPGTSLVVGAEMCEGNAAALTDIAVGVQAKFVHCGGLLAKDRAPTACERLCEIEDTLKERGMLVVPTLEEFQQGEYAMPDPPPEVALPDPVTKDKKKK